MKYIYFTGVLQNINSGVFVQIGAFNGYNNEEYGLRNKLIEESHTAFLIEPIKNFFNEIKNNYQSSKSNITTINCAVSEKEELKIIETRGQDTSFVRQFNANYPPDNTETVLCKPLTSILSEFKIQNIDVLVIDTEGYEYKILNSFFEKPNANIKIIRYEFWWLSEDQKIELDSLLERNGYDIFQDANSYADKIAIHKTFVL
jgi:hypothetical protein